MRYVNLALLGVVCYLGLQVYNGSNGYADLKKLELQIAEQSKLNQELALQNLKARVNIDAVKAQQQIIEALARRQLLMVGPDQVFYRIIK